jgi:hypothetical protein
MYTRACTNFSTRASARTRSSFAHTHTHTHTHTYTHTCAYTHVHTQNGQFDGWGKKRGLVLKTLTACACVLVWVLASLGKRGSLTFSIFVEQMVYDQRSSRAKIIKNRISTKYGLHMHVRIKKCHIWFRPTYSCVKQTFIINNCTGRSTWGHHVPWHWGGMGHWPTHRPRSVEGSAAPSKAQSTERAGWRSWGWRWKFLAASLYGKAQKL